jgi:DNA-binding transcriptional regulator YiaG
MTSVEIKTLRTELKLTQYGLAKAVGVHRITVIRWETGRAQPFPHHVQRLLQLGHIKWATCPCCQGRGYVEIV